ncbi:MAG: hypothetical protein U9R47_11505 [Actinomycetota bacterium]|nr:hypothetical protein [Actinomycetota bacterium]
MRRALVAIVVMLAVSARGGSDVEGVDRRPGILAELGGPDAFVVTVDEVDDTVVRLESWRYYETATQIDFIDGEVLWSVAIDSLPDGTLYPLWYDPAEFTMLTSMEEVLSVLDDVALTEIDPGEEAMPDTVLLAGDQLLLAFTDDKLVYVETYPLSPEESES